MPKVRRQYLPPALFQHLLDRIQSRKIPATQLELLAAWLDTTKDPEALPVPAVFEAMEDASKRLADDRRIGLDKILQDVALRMPTGTARDGLDMLAWAEGSFYHAWRLAESLRIASGRGGMPAEDQKEDR